MSLEGKQVLVWLDVGRYLPDLDYKNPVDGRQKR